MNFTPTEQDLLRSLALAKKPAEIAAARCVSVQTVRNQICLLYEKIDVHSAAEACAWAWQNGYGEAAQ